MTHAIKNKPSQGVSKTLLNFGHSLERLTELTESDDTHGYSLLWGKVAD